MVSIIIVNYLVKESLFDCIKSIISSKPVTPYEIIVVDNDENKTIKNELVKNFPKVVYIPNENRGFGEGNNVGALRAKGEYLFFLNPDTKVLNQVIDNLVKFLNKNREVGIAAPLLNGHDNKPYQQGSLELTPVRGIISLSFLNKLFPNNPVSKKYFLGDWNKKTVKEVDVIPGTAFMIRKKIFNNIGGFDEKFFLYFEEFDLCKRVKRLGYKIFINPGAKVIHYWGESTKKRKDIDKIFMESRFYYFKKHFGVSTAVFTEILLRINKYHILLFIILMAGIILRLYRIQETMLFISEQGWFYLSARDLVLNGNIPLVGIASSHPWLHQGAFWTYMMAGVFWLTGFNPLNGAYLSILLDITAAIFLYKLAINLFKKSTGLIAVLLYATSPLIISNARMPYHTNPIPLFTILFIYFVIKWVKGNIVYFPLTLITLVCLYNFELATLPFWLIFVILIIFGFIKREKWATGLLNKKILFFSFLSFVIPLLPILIYDTGHNFPQTIGYMSWIGYRILVFFGYPPLHPEIPTSTFSSFISFAVNSNQQLIFAHKKYIALLIFLASTVYLVNITFTNVISKKYHRELLTFTLIFTVSILGFIFIKTPSQAYLPMLFPVVILTTAFFWNGICDYFSGKSSYLFIAIIAGIAIINSIYQIISLNKSTETFSRQINLAKQIIRQSSGKEYNLIGPKGFETFYLNYEYLTWWLGHPPSKEKQKLIFVINGNKIIEKNYDNSNYSHKK